LRTVYSPRSIRRAARNAYTSLWAKGRHMRGVIRDTSPRLVNQGIDSLVLWSRETLTVQRNLNHFDVETGLEKEGNGRRAESTHEARF
jgi:hypothetical protein